MMGSLALTDGRWLVLCLGVLIVMGVALAASIRADRWLAEWTSTIGRRISEVVKTEGRARRVVHADGGALVVGRVYLAWIPAHAEIPTTTVRAEEISGITFGSAPGSGRRLVVREASGRCPIEVALTDPYDVAEVSLFAVDHDLVVEFGV